MFLQSLFEFFIHLDQHLYLLIRDFGNWSYLVLFFMIFCETGLVVIPFLPGDSLIFAAGAIAATKFLEIGLLFIILSIAAIAGDFTNYWIGFFMRSKVASAQKIRFIKSEYLVRTKEFYVRYGGKTIFLARFIPIIRTFAPFVAGIARMTYRQFLFYNSLGGFAWVAICISGGYLFGNVPVVKAHFSIIVLGIIGISLAPVLFNFLRQSFQSQKFTKHNAEKKNFY